MGALGCFLKALFVLCASTAGSSARYQACMPSRFGADCGGECQCREFEDCHDGPAGDGQCTCQFGQWHRCGQDSPLAAAAVQAASWHPQWDNRQLRMLRVDVDTSAQSRPVLNASLSHVLPTPFQSEQLLVTPVFGVQFGCF